MPILRTNCAIYLTRSKAASVGGLFRFKQPGYVAYWHKPALGDGQSMSALPSISDINLFSYFQRIIDLDAEISNRAFDLGMP